MALTVTVIPGKRFAATEKITIPKLNQLGQPTFSVTGTVSTGDIADASITGDKTVPSDHFYAEGVGFAAGIYTLTYLPAPPLIDGMIVAFKASANGVPDVTNGISLIIAGSGGAKRLRKHKTQEIEPGDIVQNQIVEARYDAAGDSWQMTSQTSNVPVYYTATATGTNDYSLVLTPPASYPFTLADLDGKRIRFKVPTTNTGPVTVAVTIGGVAIPLGPKQVRKNFNLPLAAGDLRQYQMAEIVYETNTVATTDAFQLMSPIANTTGDSAILADARNLTIQNNPAAPANVVDVMADEVVLRDAGGRNYLAKGVSLSIDMTATAGHPNALDIGAEAPNEWYYVWLIYNGVTVDGLFSLSSTNPQMPIATNAYTHKALVGVIRNSGGNFLNFITLDRQTWIDQQLVFTAKAATTALVYQILSGTELTNFQNCVPPIARLAFGNGGGTATESSIVVAACNADGTLFATAAPPAFAGIGASACIVGNIAAVVDGFIAACPFTVPVRGGPINRNIQWKSRHATALNRMTITGYTI